eukprot:TRINITY_DN7604_c0_g1_i3.p1 TRINITY_DN7604_c0_g1~~TRINITY_DN7604_c0_g1_i3.p1  ORF type:complete len:230 (+),score=30.43 TRINITY_DN7604_c0_g1_i3:66-755(+)
MATVLKQAPIGNVKEQRFSPYENNGGTTMGVCGKDFAVLAGDTRMSQGYSILSRVQPKIIQLTDKCVLVTAGMQADMATLHKTLVTRIQMYYHQCGKQMSTPAIAQMLANTLYYKRFFPYYTFNVLGGIDEQGVGAIYSYDAVGSYERVKYSSSGTGQMLVQPLLDNQVSKNNQVNVVKSDLTVNEAEALVKDAFNSAGERDIYTGDYVEMWTVSAAGVKKERFELKFD